MGYIHHLSFCNNDKGHVLATPASMGENILETGGRREAAEIRLFLKLYRGSSALLRKRTCKIEFSLARYSRQKATDPRSTRIIFIVRLIVSCKPDSTFLPSPLQGN